jgi:hypothetical protein
VFDEVARITYQDLDPNTRPSNLDVWRALWPSCTDPVGEASADYGGGEIKPSLGIIGCIRRGSNGKKLRVKLPDRKLSTFFAGVVGIRSLRTTAIAEAGLSAVDTGVLPFAGPAGGVICLKNPPNGLSVDQVCPGSTSGNFGYLASPRPSWDAGFACNGGQNEVVQQNIAQGIDHNLQAWAAGDPDIKDICTGLAVTGTPNYLNFQTGNISGTLEDGFITGSQEGGNFADGQPARLARSSPCVVKGGLNQNFVPNVLALPAQPSNNLEWCGVWAYMRAFTSLDVGPDVTTQIPQACYDLKALASKKNLTGIKSCFTAYAAGGYTTQLFLSSVRDADRFAWIPESVEDLSGINGNTWFHVQRFRAVFIQTIYYDNGNKYAAYNPGEALPLASDCSNCKNFTSVTALLFDPNMLPAELRTPASNNNLVTSIGLIK